MNRRDRRRSARLGLDTRLPGTQTGQAFPPGVHLHDGHCERCTSRGRSPLASMVLEPMGIRYAVCAECLSDFVAGAGLMGARVYARTIEGSFKEVRVS